MAGITPRIHINAEGLENLFTSIAGAVDLTKNGIGERIADILREDAAKQFAEGGIPNWRPLSPVTIRRKEALGYPRLNRRGQIPRTLVQRGQFGPQNILIMTGALRTSWTDKNDPHHFEEIKPNSVSTGSDLAYAGTHQEGGQTDGGHEIPARPIVITDEARAKIAELVETEALNTEH